jgi:hypothetical protein
MAIGLVLCPPSAFGSDKDGKDHFSTLPDEAKQAILHNVPPKELGTLAQVNKDLHNHANDDLLWKKKVYDAVGPVTKKEDESWKDVYRRVAHPLNVLKTDLAKIKNEFSPWLLSYKARYGSLTPYANALKLVEENKTEEEIFEAAVLINDPQNNTKFTLFHDLDPLTHPINSIVPKELAKVFQILNLQDHTVPVNYWKAISYAFEHKIPILLRSGGLAPIPGTAKDWLITKKMIVDVNHAFATFVKNVTAVKGEAYRADALKTYAAKNPYFAYMRDFHNLRGQP